MKRALLFLVVCAQLGCAHLAFSAAALAPAGELVPAGPKSAKLGLVVSQDGIASDVGWKILTTGGNATDAAIATAFALAVTHPQAGNIGGGGFIVYRDHDGRAESYDFRETAPAGSRPDMWLKNGTYSAELHHESCLSVGVPGTVAGLYLAWKEHGSKPWKTLVDPAVKIAENGFKVSAGLALAFQRYEKKTRVFRSGKLYKEGELLKQTELAQTLKRIRDLGPRGFYEGVTAKSIEQQMKQCGGLITQTDLKNYAAKKRDAIKGQYRGYEIIGMGPPSSAGVAILEVLKILEGYDLKQTGFKSAQTIHLVAESLKRAFADRAHDLGDPDFSPIPVEKLLSEKHVEALRKSINTHKASVSSPGTFSWPMESAQTTHLSIVDAKRNAVSLTYTLEDNFGSGVVVSGAGFLLNNEMGDFNAAPGLTDKDGHIGTVANLAQPGKRMLSSMAPTIVTKDGKLFMVTGSPGGRTIISTVLLTLINVIDFGQGAQEAVDAVRIHHQWQPDILQIERNGLSADVVRALAAKGHKIEEVSPQGAAEVILVSENNILSAGVDHRSLDGKASGK